MLSYDMAIPNTTTAVCSGSPAWVKAKRRSYSAMPTASAPISRAMSQIWREASAGSPTSLRSGLTGGSRAGSRILSRI